MNTIQRKLHAKTEMYSLCRIINKLERTTEENCYYIEYGYGKPRLYKREGQGAREVSPRMSPTLLSLWLQAWLEGHAAGYENGKQSLLMEQAESLLENEE